LFLLGLVLGFNLFNIALAFIGLHHGRLKHDDGDFGGTGGCGSGCLRKCGSAEHPDGEQAGNGKRKLHEQVNLLRVR
jgi:hypothetical protein